MEGSKYLSFAERIISAHGVPLTGQQIIDHAIRYDILPFNNYETIVKTLQARISEDIAEKGEGSRFIRTGTGAYFLRRMINERTIYGSVRANFCRPRRSKPDHPNRILAISTDNAKLINENQNNRILELQNLISTGVLVDQKQVPDDYIPILSATSIKFCDCLLSFSIGKHTHFKHLTNRRTIFIRRFIDEFDFSFFDTENFLFISSALRAIIPLLSFGRKDYIEKNIFFKPQFEFDIAMFQGRFFPDVILSTNGSYLLVASIIDISGFFNRLPTIARRLEIKKPMWDSPLLIEKSLHDEDALLFLNRCLMKDFNQ